MSSPTISQGAPPSRQEFPAKHAAPELSRYALDALHWLHLDDLDDDCWMPWKLGQELLDAGLVARTIHEDGRTTYRLTAAGKAWRAAC